MKLIFNTILSSFLIIVFFKIISILIPNNIQYTCQDILSKPIDTEIVQYSLSNTLTQNINKNSHLQSPSIIRLCTTPCSIFPQNKLHYYDFSYQKNLNQLSLTHSKNIQNTTWYDFFSKPYRWFNIYKDNHNTHIILQSTIQFIQNFDDKSFNQVSIQKHAKQNLYYLFFKKPISENQDQITPILQDFYSQINALCKNTSKDSISKSSLYYRTRYSYTFNSPMIEIIALIPQNTFNILSKQYSSFKLIELKNTTLFEGKINIHASNNTHIKDSINNLPEIKDKLKLFFAFPNPTSSRIKTQFIAIENP